MKLTAHHMGSSNSAGRLVAGVKPRFVKLVHAFADAARYKSAVPGLQIIGRFVAHPDWPASSFEPLTAAEHDFATVRSVALQHPLVDFWESGNEINPGNYTEMGRISAYDLRFMELCEVAGLKACIGNFSTGNPGPRIEPITDTETIQRYWAAYRPALERASRSGHLLGLHEYLGGDDADTWLQYRYRRVLDYCRANGITPPRIAITECGVDGVMGLHPWRDQYGDGPDGQRAYVERLVRYEQGLRRDPEVVCAAIFTSGTNGAASWRRHDIDGTQIPEMLAEWARTNPETPAQKPNPAPAVIVGRRVRVRVSGLNLRPRPGVDNTPMTTMLYGTEMVVQEQAGLWGRVTKDGWVNCAPAYVDIV